MWCRVFLWIWCDGTQLYTNSTDRELNTFAKIIYISTVFCVHAIICKFRNGNREYGQHKKNGLYTLAENREDCVTELSFGNLQFYNVMYVMLWAAWSFVFVFFFFPDCNSCTIFLPNFSRFDKVFSLSENFITSFVPRDIRDKTRSFFHQSWHCMRTLSLMMENRFHDRKTHREIAPSPHYLETHSLRCKRIRKRESERRFFCQENFPFIQC